MSDQMRERLAELSKEVKAVDMHARVLRGSRRVTMRNRTAGSAIALIALGGFVAGFGALRAQPPTPPAQTPPPGPSPIDVWKIYNSELTLPAFPGPASATCPGGTFQMLAGMSPELPLRFLPRTVQGDIDGAAGDELLIRVDCDGYGQVLALKVDAGQVTVLGYVLGSSPGSGYVIESGEDAIRIDNGVILVTLQGPMRADRQSVEDKQVRGYRYLPDSTFLQVSGPTSFAEPAVSTSEFADSTLEILLPYEGAKGQCKLTNGAGQVTIDDVAYNVQLLASAALADRRYGAALLELRASHGSALRTIHVYELRNGAPSEPAVLEQRNVGAFFEASKVEAEGATFKITVGGEVWAYGQTAGGEWKRIA